MIEVIKFYADWCGPCRLYAKIYDKVSLELKNSNFKFSNVDVEKDIEGLAAKYKVSSIPFTVVIKEGKTKSQVGLMDESTLKNFILDE